MNNGEFLTNQGSNNCLADSAGTVTCSISIASGQAFALLTDGVFNFEVDNWSYNFNVADNSDGAVIHSGSASGSNLSIYVPLPPLSDSQADFD